MFRERVSSAVNTWQDTATTFDPESPRGLANLCQHHPCVWMRELWHEGQLHTATNSRLQRFSLKTGLLPTEGTVVLAKHRLQVWNQKHTEPKCSTVSGMPWATFEDLGAT